LKERERNRGGEEVKERWKKSEVGKKVKKVDEMR